MTEDMLYGHSIYDATEWPVSLSRRPDTHRQQLVVNGFKGCDRRRTIARELFQKHVDRCVGALGHLSLIVRVDAVVCSYRVWRAAAFVRVIITRSGSSLLGAIDKPWIRPLDGSEMRENLVPCPATIVANWLKCGRRKCTKGRKHSIAGYMQRVEKFRFRWRIRYTHGCGLLIACTTGQ